jgi:hypothetical protein
LVYWEDTQLSHSTQTIKNQNYKFNKTQQTNTLYHKWAQNTFTVSKKSGRKKRRISKKTQFLREPLFDTGWRKNKAEENLLRKLNDKNVYKDEHKEDLKIIKRLTNVDLAFKKNRKCLH